MPTHNPLAAKEMEEEREEQRFEARAQLANKIYKQLTYGEDMALTYEVITNEATDCGLITALMLLHKTDGGDANAIRLVIDAMEDGFWSYADREAERRTP